MGALARIVTGRRSKWLVVLVWVAATVPFSALGSQLADVTDNRTESFLPSDAESTEALLLQEQRFPGGEAVTGLIVYRRTGGLTDADQAEIAADSERAADTVPLLAPPVVPFTEGAPPELVSPGRDLAYTIVAVPDDNDRIPEWGTDLRDVVHEQTPDGLDVYVTGGIGFNADFEAVFGDIDVKVLTVTVVLVLVLLGVIYRSPLIALIPLVVVGIAYTIARGLVYLYADSGATVSDNGTSILVVLMFGVGTDYCLLLVSRYREELRRHEDKHDAMEIAIRRAGPAILASGLTVALTMLVLLVATIGSTNSLGPVSAIGVTVAFVAGLTLLPALLTVSGRRGFWPRHHTVEFRPDGSAVQADFNEAAARDLRLIVPLALLVIFVILAVLLQALVAPVLLIASVVVSFLGTLGLSILFFIYVIGDTGVDNSLPTYAFIFLVALGVDYTIFLMSRVREEARHHGTREGTLRALAATGPVITSAGIILAGTFSVLLTLPVTFIFDLGFMVAVGILLDTFIVRTIMVPALVELVGDRVWWPSSASGGGHALHGAREAVST